MFSSFSSILPSLALPDKDSPFDRLLAVKRRFEGARTSVDVPVEARTEPERQEPEREPEQEETREQEKAQRKQKLLNETFVVVRPPPSVSNHPLNLQLQLIPPAVQTHVQRSASTSTTGSASSDKGYAGAGGVPNVPPISAGLQSRKEARQEYDDELTRVRSNRSDLSLFYSSIGSSASVQSFATTASHSSTTSTRRIIPLYNLAAHNVLQNTVQDAGTDATVSRFRKRGIDVLGLGILEPIEVHGAVPVGGAAGYIQQADVEAASDIGHGSNLGHGSVFGAPSESDHSPPLQTSALRDPSPTRPSQLRELALPDRPSTPKESTGKKLFGKIFKKKEATPNGGLLSPTMATPRGSLTASSPNRASMLIPPSPTPARESFPRATGSRPASIYSVIPGSINVPVSPLTSPVPPTPTQGQTGGVYLQPPVLGTQATLRSEVFPPSGRPTAYVWVLRRWTKGESMLAGLVGSGGVDMSRVGVEVRFEWVRGKKKRRQARPQIEEPPMRGANGRPLSVVSVGLGEECLGVPEAGSLRSASPSSRRGSESKPNPRTRVRRDSRRSASPTKPRGSSGSEDEDSDPEDSETPWSCTLRVLPIDAETGGGMKLRLAHLVPAPHHPKVIGQFKMPFPLPDVAVQRLELVPRSTSDPFGMKNNRGSANDMVMTAEEIKDVVCTTGLWLMVREGFGGLSKKKRKGDGFKIRS